jgi:magnesium chelatase subunit I
MEKQPSARTLGALKASGYAPRSVKQEMRDNLVQIIRKRENPFPGVLGFDDTVIPDIERAILSRHNILLLGLRGQAKTRIARQMIHLLDEYMPIVAGSELNDDPLQPLSRYAKDLIAAHGDDTPVEWVHRTERYVEKLATPDVSIGDLVGDVDPIKAATLKLPYSDERVIHFGLIPRANRCLFVINELPDLQARIQVALFNVLQEGDMQIRGFKLRLPLDVAFVFTANPEDYTNRGSIITPLKDRIESQITTHYPTSIEIGRQITGQEAKISHTQHASVYVSPLLRDLIEEVAQAARNSPFVDQKSGVSARLTISALESLYAAAERRMIRNGETSTAARINDLWGIIPAITGKVEVVYEGEQEGPHAVAMSIIGMALKHQFLQFFDDPDAPPDADASDPYGVMKAWFLSGNRVNLLTDMTDADFQAQLSRVMGASDMVKSAGAPEEDRLLFTELLLHGMAESNLISRSYIRSAWVFNDTLSDNPDEDIDDRIMGLFN